MMYISEVMMLKILVISLLSFCLSGCSVSSQKISSSEFENFKTLISEEEKNNKQGVNWDGKSASIVTDELDDTNVLDGRSGEFYYEFIETDSYTIRVKSTLLNGSKETFDGDNYKLKGDDWVFTVRAVDLESEVYELSNNTTMFEVATDLLEYYEEAYLYCGINEDSYAGYTMLVRHGSKSFRLDYYGLGIMEEIESTSHDIFSKLMIKYE